MFVHFLNELYALILIVDYFYITIYSIDCQINYRYSYFTLISSSKLYYFYFLVHVYLIILYVIVWF